MCGNKQISFMFRNVGNVMLEVDCRKCVNCTGKECIPFGKDPNEAVKKCADDGFRNYVTIDELNKREQKATLN